MAEEELPGAKRASEQAGRYREAMEKIRQRTDYTSKALATIGTAAIAGIGYAKLSDVFPWGGLNWAVCALGLGVLLMIAAVFLLIRLFASAGESVFTSSDLRETFHRNGIKDKDEKLLIKKIYDEAADRGGANSLGDYETQALAMEKEAKENDASKIKKVDANIEAVVKALRSRADQIFNEIQAAQDRAAALLLRNRAHRAVFGWGMAACVFVFVVGWYATAVAADYLQGEHTESTEQIALAKSCAEARAAKKVVEDKIPTVCGTQLKADKEKEASEEQKATAKARLEVTAAIAAAVQSCQATAKDGEEEKTCAALKRALASAAESGGR